MSFAKHIEGRFKEGKREEATKKMWIFITDCLAK